MIFVVPADSLRLMRARPVKSSKRNVPVPAPQKPPYIPMKNAISMQSMRVFEKQKGSFCDSKVFVFCT